MRSPDEFRSTLAERFARQHRRWFAERDRSSDAWPLALELGHPTEQDFITEPVRVREWVMSWERLGPLPAMVSH